MLCVFFIIIFIFKRVRGWQLVRFDTVMSANNCTSTKVSYSTRQGTYAVACQFTLFHNHFFDKFLKCYEFLVCTILNLKRILLYLPSLFIFISSSVITSLCKGENTETTVDISSFFSRLSTHFIFVFILLKPVNNGTCFKKAKKHHSSTLPPSSSLPFTFLGRNITLKYLKSYHHHTIFFLFTSHTQYPFKCIFLYFCFLYKKTYRKIENI